MFVARGVPLDAFKYIDQGNNRTLKDVMDCAGWDASTTLSAAGRYLWVYEETGTPFGQVRPERNLSAGSLFDWVEQYAPSISKEWEKNRALVIAARKGIKMSEGIMFFLWLKMSASDHGKAVQVFTYLANPLDRTIDEPSLAFQFAVKIIDDLQIEMKQLKGRGMKTRSDEHRDPCTSALIYAWNCLIAGKTHKTVRGFKAAVSKAEYSTLWTIK